MSEMSEQAKLVMSWYSYLTPQQQQNLLRLMNYGRLSGTGKFVILPVDQDQEHTPAASFGKNAEGYLPAYHSRLACSGGCNGLVLPYGAMRRVASAANEVSLPMIMKINFSTPTMPKANPLPACYEMELEEAARLGCIGFGFTIYPGSEHEALMFEQLNRLVVMSRELGLLAVVWAYPRGKGLPQADSGTVTDLSGKVVNSQADIESAVDIVASGVRSAFQLGADIVKCKPPKPIVALPLNVKKEAYKGVPLETLTDRVKHIVSQAAFGGEGIVIFSGGEAKGTEEVLEEIRQIKAGGGFGSIVGRNSFQRPFEEGVSLLNQIQDIYAEA